MSACARASARRKAATVRGFFAAKSAVTATPPIGMPAVAPALASSVLTAPNASAACVLKGSTVNAASTVPLCSAAAMSGKGTSTNVTASGVDARGLQRGARRQLDDVAPGVDGDLLAGEVARGPDVGARLRDDQQGVRARLVAAVDEPERAAALRLGQQRADVVGERHVEVTRREARQRGRPALDGDQVDREPLGREVAGRLRAHPDGRRRRSAGPRAGGADAPEQRVAATPWSTTPAHTGRAQR